MDAFEEFFITTSVSYEELVTKIERDEIQLVSHPKAEKDRFPIQIKQSVVWLTFIDNMLELIECYHPYNVEDFAQWFQLTYNDQLHTVPLLDLERRLSYYD